MAAHQTENGPGAQTDSRRALKRRGLIAGAGALVAGIIAKQVSQPVAAIGVQGNGDGQALLITANSAVSGYTANHGTLPTMLFNIRSGTPAPSGSSLGDAFLAATLNGVGVDGFSNAGTGVQGRGGGDTSTNDTGFPIGVRGSIPDIGYAVYGQAGSGFGIYGNAPGGIGVGGDSGNTGVRGQATGSAANTIAVKGLNQSTGTGGIGVEGVADLASGIGVVGGSAAGVGVKGVSTSGTPAVGQVLGAANGNPGVLGTGTAGPGVQGQSTTGHGLIGYTTATDGHAALIGYAQAAGGVGLIGVAPGNAGQWAGVFYGDVHIAGTMAAPVSGVAAAHPDGTSRLLQAVVAPEGWVEDFGEGTLAGGTAEVKLDADFAALVDTGTLHVFTEAHGPEHLHVAGRTATGFTVVATSVEGQAGGVKAPTKPPGGTFSYRVVARRKEGAGGRLAKLAAPPAPKPFTPVAVPETPEVKPPTTKP